MIGGLLVYCITTFAFARFLLQIISLCHANNCMFYFWHLELSVFLAQSLVINSCISC